MKKIICILFVFFAFSHLQSQTPQTFKYQAVVRNASGNFLANQNVSFQISILQGSIFGNSVFTETHVAVTNEFGLVNLEIGNGILISGDFSMIDWGNDLYFLKTEMDETGGSNYVLIGTTQLLSVPYALHSKTAETLTAPITEIDPVFSASVASGITSQDTMYWNAKVDTIVETDPVFGVSVAGGILSEDTTRWNNKQDTLTAGSGINISGNVISTSGMTHYIGELFGGGIVVAVWKESGIEHGLIASLTDISTTSTWSNLTSTTIGLSAQSPTDGQANTNAIIAQAGHTSSAAKLCDDYSEGDFSDWYLPAIWELYQCNNVAVIVNSVLGPEDGFKFQYYWSSTEHPSSGSHGYVQYFFYGYSGGDYKSSYRIVRAVRRF